MSKKCINFVWFCACDGWVRRDATWRGMALLPALCGMLWQWNENVERNKNAKCQCPRDSLTTILPLFLFSNVWNMCVRACMCWCRAESRTKMSVRSAIQHIRSTKIHSHTRPNGRMIMSGITSTYSPQWECKVVYWFVYLFFISCCVVFLFCISSAAFFSHTRFELLHIFRFIREFKILIFLFLCCFATFSAVCWCLYVLLFYSVVLPYKYCVAKFCFGFVFQTFFQRFVS